MIKRIALILAFAITLCLFSGCSQTGGDTIKIGSVHPLSGSMAYEGQAMVNAQLIAIDKINKMGGINGKMLELVTADSLGTADGAASAALKLMNSGIVALTGTYTSSSSQTVSREAEKAKILRDDLQGNKPSNIQRSKGLGENDPEMMAMTTMNPETRRLIKVMPEDAERTALYFDILLGDSLNERKNFIAENGAKYLEMADIS